MAHTVTERGLGGVDVSDFHAVALALKRSQITLRLQMARSLKVAGNLVAKDAKAIASQHSESIPPTIKTQVRGASVAVVAGGGDVHIAGLYELGNKEGGKSHQASETGYFRHPVFSRDVWVEQPRWAFLAPAGKKQKPKTDAAILAACDEAAKVATTL